MTPPRLIQGGSLKSLTVVVFLGRIGFDVGTKGSLRARGAYPSKMGRLSANDNASVYALAA